MSAANRRRGADAERAVVITFDPPEAPLSMNDRLHWAKRSRLTAAWRDTTAWEAMRAIPPADRPLPRCEVAVTIPFGRRAQRDPHNYFATVKPIVDGLVDAGLWPNDTPKWVRTVEPTLTVDKPRGPVVITLTPLPTEGTP